jgi:hypothetical protein
MGSAGVDDPLASAASAHCEHDRPSVAGADDRVCGASGAVKEVPGPERSFPPLHDQQALARQDQEALLVVLAVIHRQRLARFEDADVDPDLLEPPLALEVAPRAERAVVAPTRLGAVDDEPALALGSEAEARRPERCLGDGHGTC